MELSGETRSASRLASLRTHAGVFVAHFGMHNHSPAMGGRRIHITSCICGKISQIVVLESVIVQAHQQGAGLAEVF
jgi:hypothetical protein